MRKAVRLAKRAVQNWKPKLHAPRAFTDQFRKGMKAVLYSCLVPLVSAGEHSKSTIDGSRQGKWKNLSKAERCAHQR